MTNTNKDTLNCKINADKAAHLKNKYLSNKSKSQDIKHQLILSLKSAEKYVS